MSLAASSVIMGNEQKVRIYGVPARDRYHGVVVRALAKAGWTIIGEQVAIVLGGRRLWIDIQAAKGPQRLAILVEVKGFENLASPVDYLAAAVGKYVLYRAALDYGGITTPLFMAVPDAAHEGILSEDIGREAVLKAGVRLIVFNPVAEEISQWIQ